MLQLPSELHINILKFCDASTLARVDKVSRGFHAPLHESLSLVEQTLRQRFATWGHSIPDELPTSERSWTQLLLLWDFTNFKIDNPINGYLNGNKYKGSCNVKFPVRLEGIVRENLSGAKGVPVCIGSQKRRSQ